jgi:hypothetical protein
VGRIRGGVGIPYGQFDGDSFKIKKLFTYFLEKPSAACTMIGKVGESENFLDN